MSWVDVIIFAMICAFMQLAMPQLKLWSTGSSFYSYLTAHLVHLHWQHWCMNMLALLCLPLLLPQIKRWQFWIASLFFAVCISMALTFGEQLLDQGLSDYVGFSGVLHGLYMLFALQTYVQTSEGYLRWQSVTLVIGLVIKTVYETHFQPTHSADFLGASVVYAAHMDGVVVGVSVFIAWYFLYFLRQKGGC